MGKPNTRHLDREIQLANRKLDAVREFEMWPLNGPERRAIIRATVGGSVRVVRGRSTTRAERKLETAWNSAETRLMAEIVAFEKERQRIVNEAAAAKAAKKSSGWW
ncbi:hypothetical protein GCM10023084_00560 [Streptomyces lacrimifluminis]|uniref:Uncharacterized protein n=1 Tax=Streptomyces lacrimifluminis TaxID=1500077 RepID=A0A917NS24_9ACTN|nr:hypothetical protein [Streptomyces lacrimifluminis]GGJ20159.1 hypothetical protein GCM10012282_15640 [Streptomyces lacrimifluminis]